MADKLTPQQHQAVVNRGGQLLVSAAAGSGKTKVLVDRLLCYLTDPGDPADLDDFLIITYTKAAATELRGKIAAKLTERIALEPDNRHLQKQMQRLFLTKISTVHGFCGDLLREYAYRLDLSADFRIADENECREIRDQVLTELLDRSYETSDRDEYFRAFVDTQGLGRTDKLVPEIIEKVYDSARCHKDPQKWLDDCMKASQIEGIADIAQTVWGEYLLNDLRDYLSCQIAALEECCRMARRVPEFSKVLLNLESILQQLQQLREAKTWDEAVKGCAINYGRLTFPRKNPEPDLAERIKAVRSGCKDALEKKLSSFTDGSSQILQDLEQASAGVRGLISLVEQFDRDYTAAKKRRRCLDFGDLEHKTLDLLLGKGRSSATAAAEEIAERFREILVDEYQDSNGVQDAIFSTLTQKRKNLFLVGDVKQSIYQFRLADPGIFLDKYNRFLPADQAEAGQGRKILLSDNFRSGGEIVEAVNDVFRECMRPRVGGLVYGEGEALREGIPHDPLPDPAVELHAIRVQEESYPEEAEYVAQRILEMLTSGTPVRDKNGFRPVKPEDIVILLRSPGSTGVHFQKALHARGIRYVSGSGTELLQTQEITTVRNLLQTIMNPRLDIPLIATLASPLFGFSADLLGKIRSVQKKGSFYDALLLDNSIQARRFLLILDTLRREASVSTVSSLLEQCYTLTRIDSIFAAMPSGKVRAANLQLFYQMAVDFEKGNVRDLSQFLDHLTALEGRGIPGTDSASTGCVTIMSIHKSKGLEYPVVFLCNLSKKFNQDSLRTPILCDKTLGIGLSIADAENRIRYPSVSKRAISVKMASESLSEEMRVLYVALTRARDRLIMTYASRNLEKKLQNIARRADADRGELLCRDAVSMGDWILFTALKRTEAGLLHAEGDRPNQTRLSQYPWKITVGTAPQSTAAATEEKAETKIALNREFIQKLRKNLNYQYPYPQATTAPSKQTATGRKGRVKDDESAQNTREPEKRMRSWRKPSFISNAADPTAYGNAMHRAMQHIDFRSCHDHPSVCAELSRLEQKGILSREQLELINTHQIAAFFASPIGRKLCAGADCIREFKFSILDRGDHYSEGLEREQVLLQGVVDCAVLEPDGITVLDFKTDRVTEDSLASAASRYQAQVEAYAQALSRIYAMPVKNASLYFFRVDRFVRIL